MTKALRLINTLRNKCAHHISYIPNDIDFEPILRYLKDVEAGSGVNLHISNASGRCKGNEGFKPDYMHLCEALSIALESRARSIGVSEVDADSIIAPDNWEAQYY